MSMWLLSLALHFQLNINPVDISTTVLDAGDTEPWLLEEVSQWELLQPAVQRLPRMRRCIKPSLI